MSNPAEQILHLNIPYVVFSIAWSGSNDFCLFHLFCCRGGIASFRPSRKVNRIGPKRNHLTFCTFVFVSTSFPRSLFFPSHVPWTGISSGFKIDSSEFWPQEVPLYKIYTGTCMCRPKGHVFLGAQSINRVSFLVL